MLLLPTSYLPPIQYFAKLLSDDRVLIEAHETYPKQTYRNRCVIYSCNGPLPLIIPVIKPRGNRTPTKDVRLDNSVKWQREHWRALVSAYNKSAYFELISDELAPFYHQPREFLMDYNQMLIEAIARILGVSIRMEYTDSYLQNHNDGVVDLREAIHPKPQRSKPDGEFTPPLYFQVFADRHGFIPNLSIIDMVCNCGRDSVRLIKGE